MMRSSPKLALVLACVLSGTLVCWTGCQPSSTSDSGESAGSTGRPTVAFVTNQIADFWAIAKAGCLDAEKEFDVDVEVRMPREATAVMQKQIVEDLMTSGVAAIAISPLAAEDQQDFLNQVAEKVHLITHDSDAPNSDRLMYIGMDNYAAGRDCGKLVKSALPDGGNVILFIGRLEQNNSKYRRQGVIDELLDRPVEAGRFDDPPEDVIEGEKYTILATRTDGGDAVRAKQIAEDSLTSYPDINAMVGLFEYNPVACYQALEQADKLGEIKLIGFDENDITLQAIKDGYCEGTIVQNPYQYGFKSVEIMASLIKGDESVIPESKFIDIPPRTITKENVDEYWDDLRAKKGV